MVPCSVSVPVLIFVNAPVRPEITPEFVKLNVLVSIVSVCAALMGIARAIVPILAASCSVEVPVTVRAVPPVPNAASALMLIVPALIVVPLPYVLVPCNVSVPALIFVNAPVAPEITPEFVKLNVLVSIVSVCAALIGMALAMAPTLAASCSVEVPVTVRAVPPVPSAASALMLIVPPLIVVPLPYVLVPCNVSVPALILVNAGTLTLQGTNTKSRQNLLN